MSEGMRTNELRKKFLDYFKKHGHTIVPSSSLVPSNDPTLLFTNAGMVQFKDTFLGHDPRSYSRAASVQRCVRAGGKHNDLENVGYTARHHTFFEMLGNFSFGDYFKREAITFAWNFLTHELKLPPQKLWVTVYKDDTEAAEIWLKELNVDPARFSYCGEKDNFWSMGDTGPCGPCTEIFYDHGPEVPGGPPGSADAEGDRYIEIWNLVFMQYNRLASGELVPLAHPCVDTGMGIERAAAVLQGVHSNYDIDIFRHLIKSIAELGSINDLSLASLKVIADHLRSASFLIADGVRPSNEGRGYVLRRIIRRAIRHGHKLAIPAPFFCQLVPALVKEMGEAYPELIQEQDTIALILKEEEEQFIQTLASGLKILEQEISGLDKKIIPGEVVFKLYDTYGFPADLTADIAREKNLMLDVAGFENEMRKQKSRSKAASGFTVDYNELVKLEGETQFLGYDTLSASAIVTALIRDNQLVNSLNAGEEGLVVLDRTPFYAESGGQVGDAGELIFSSGSFRVTDTQKQGMVYLHHGQLRKGSLKVGDKVNAEVASTRTDIMLNHSATHLLHAALRRILGKHVVQKGSLVEADRLRLDFSHSSPIPLAQIDELERLVNQQIRANLNCHLEIMAPKEAIEKGALALFGEKYGEKVRVLSMGEFSVELCGGTHVKNTGEIGLFKIISETGVAAGIRRIEAVTGEKAMEWINKNEANLNEMADMLKTSRDAVKEKVKKLIEQSQEKDKLMQQLQAKLANLTVVDLLNQVRKVGDFQVAVKQFQNVHINLLREMVDELKQKLLQGVVLLASVNEDKIVMIAGTGKQVANRIKASELMQFVAKQVGGKGGGRDDLAQGGGNDIAALPTALASVSDWLERK